MTMLETPHVGLTVLLKVATGPAAGHVFDVTDETVIGREGADVVVDDPAVSRRHALLRPTANGVIVADLHSSNGTFVSGRRIDEPTLIGDAAALRLGATDFVLEIVQPTFIRAPFLPPPGDGPPEPATGRGRPGRGAIAAVALVVLALAAGGGFAAWWFTRDTASEHDMNVRGVVAVIQYIGATGAPGSTQIEIGQISGPPGGKGAARLVASVGPGGTVDGRATLYFEDGSLTAHYTGRAVLHDDGSYVITGTEEIVDSSGDFAGATGTQRVRGTGTIGKNGTFQAIGKVKY